MPFLPNLPPEEHECDCECETCELVLDDPEKLPVEDLVELVRTLQSHLFRRLPSNEVAEDIEHGPDTTATIVGVFYDAGLGPKRA